MRGRHGLSTANGNKIQIWDCTGGANQSLDRRANGTLQVYGKCMDITGANYSNGTNIELWALQRRRQPAMASQNGTLVNPASGKCLDDPNSNTDQRHPARPVDLQRRHQPAMAPALAGT